MINGNYGFGGRLTSDFPSQIVVDLTNSCNLKCIHCAHSEMVKSPNFRKASLAPLLNKKLVDEVHKDGNGLCTYIRYTADGEPMLHPQMFDMLEYAVGNCEAKITLTTNGTLLNDEKIERLVNTKLHSVDISIDAFSVNSYSAIRKNGDYEQTINNVHKLIENKKETKIFLSFISQPANEVEAEPFEKYWLDNGADYVVIRRLHSCANILSNPLKPDHIDENEKITRKPCVYPWERLVLAPNGKLTFCPAYWGRESFYLFDFNEITIMEAWQSEMINSLRNAHLSNDFGEFAMCESCMDWQQMRWPHEGRAYADLMSEM